MEKVAWGLICILVVTGTIQAQNISNSTRIQPDSLRLRTDSISNQKDIVDVFYNLTHHEPKLEIYESDKDRIHFTLVPAVGYTLQTGFAVLLAANTVFYTDKNDHSRTSTVLASIAYTQYKQIIVPVSVNIWSKNKKYNYISDIRYMDYPSQTFGLGSETKVTDGYGIDFSYLKLHQSVLRKIKSHFFGGIGYYYDYFWNTKEVNPPPGGTSFQEYGLSDKEFASGISFQGLIDKRDNPINPIKGLYSSFRYRMNDKWMGNSVSWHSGILELRKYIQFPRNSKNVIALWNYNWVTIFGKPPYLLLPSTGWDDFFNTGRGYIQGRYRDLNMSYMEAEYRFNFMSNGLLGGVLFANLQTFSNKITGLYQVAVPGYGAGLRIKMNKNSKTNLCIDYAFGDERSRGFFINLGEVFLEISVMWNISLVSWLSTKANGKTSRYKIISMSLLHAYPTGYVELQMVC